MWSDEAMKERAVARCAELGKSLRAALTEAGLSHETLDKTPAAGRRIDTLEKLAGALNWTLAELMGLEVVARVTPELFHAALMVAHTALPHLKWEDPALSEIAARTYNILATNFPDPQKPPDPATLATQAQTIASLWSANQHRKRRWR